MAVINTNYLALVSQNNLNKTQPTLGSAIQRLSSGLRINSAKDDAAGLAIAYRFLSNIKGLSQVARNTNDGVSLAQTAEGALGNVNNNLQRMRDLAVQAGNGTLSSADRQALQKEMQQLTGEVDRVAKTSSFNGQKLLNGSFSGATFQVGPNAGDNVTVGALANTQASALGSSEYAQASVAVDETAKANLQSDLAAGDIAITITGANGQSVQATMAQDADATPEEALGQFVAAVNSKSQDTGVTAFLSDDGSSIEYRARVDAGQDATQVNITATGSNDFAATGQAHSTQGIQGMDLSTQAGAWDALKRIDSAIDSVNTARSSLGSVQKRFESTINNINIQHENESAAQGRLVDADFAKEVSNLTRGMLLQHIGFTMQTQANQHPRWVLPLLTQR